MDRDTLDKLMESHFRGFDLSPDVLARPDIAESVADALQFVQMSVQMDAEAIPPSVNWMQSPAAKQVLRYREAAAVDIFDHAGEDHERDVLKGKSLNVDEIIADDMRNIFAIADHTQPLQSLMSHPPLTEVHEAESALLKVLVTQQVLASDATLRSPRLRERPDFEKDPLVSFLAAKYQALGMADMENIKIRTNEPAEEVCRRLAIGYAQDVQNYVSKTLRAGFQMGF